WHYETPLRTRSLVGLGAYVLFWLCLMGRAVVRPIRWQYPAMVCLLVWVTLAISVGAGLKTSAAHREGVITAAEVVVRKGNGEGYEPQFEQPLGEGVEFEMLEQRDDWLHVRLADGKEGWIRLREAELI
ncbi:MAG: SH3 domain-containing protein, partial [Planctomycetota bacterium]